MLPGTKVWTWTSTYDEYMVGKAFVAFIKGASCAEQPLEPVTICVNACACVRVIMAVQEGKQDQQLCPVPIRHRHVSSHVRQRFLISIGLILPRRA